MHKKIFLISFLTFFLIPSMCFSAYQKIAKTYDYYVAADGSGDFTSIATAFSTEGAGKRYYIASGTYAENTITVPSNCEIHWNNVTLNLNTGQQLSFDSVANVYMHGYVKVTGDANNFITAIGATKINAISCLIEVEWTRSSWEQYDTGVLLEGQFNSWNVLAQNYSLAGDATGLNQGLMSAGYDNQNEYHITIQNVVGPANSNRFEGFALTSSTYCRVYVSILNVTTANSRGYGLIINGGNYNSVMGSSRGCNTNSLISGTGNKTGELAT